MAADDEHGSEGGGSGILADHKDKKKQHRDNMILIGVAVGGLILTYLLYRSSKASSASGGTSITPTSGVPSQGLVAGGSSSDSYTASAIQALQAQDQQNQQQQTQALSGLSTLLQTLTNEVAGLNGSGSPSGTGSGTGPAPSSPPQSPSLPASLLSDLIPLSDAYLPAGAAGYSAGQGYQSGIVQGANGEYYSTVGSGSQNASLLAAGDLYYEPSVGQFTQITSQNQLNQIESGTPTTTYTQVPQPTPTH